ncbi:integrin alpha-4 isoform X2 [Lasioglossum baleicum]|uniref:integrin alpha-4 isoform X2 n=1 Tax=Lasioglossum baleicum TaxID=434251 RepID=UPI003FCC43B8
MPFLILLFVTLACGYNVDTNSWFNIYSSENMYLGYTVYLYHDSVSGDSWLFTGAPKGGRYSPASQNIKQPSEQGVVYRCDLKPNGQCAEIRPKEIGDEKGHISQLGLNILIKKQSGWFGSAMSIDRSNGVLTVCAPRTVVSIFIPSSNNYSDTMHGMCYSGKISSNLLSIEYDNLEFHNFQSKIWYNPLCGFSIHYASATQDESKKRIIGKPVNDICGSVEIVQNESRLSIELPSADELSQFGYSVESGNFFKKNRLLYVGGAPGWHYVGQVAILDATANSSIVARLQGNSTGEFFGASLAVGDVNNDGLDDLIVGAPYWGQDNGKVYCYFGSSKGQFEEKNSISLEGTVEGGHFGYAISSGDLDADGFDDIIVGAPWEDSGVIYIYNGGSDLKKQKLQPSQRITPPIIQSNVQRKIHRFGFSTSKPVDVDGNGYLDIPVGAYKSGHAFLLRSKPVIKTELAISVAPNVLERDARHFSINMCLRYSGHNIENLRGVKSKITLTIDEQYKQTTEIVNIESSNFSIPCFRVPVNVSTNIRDFIKPIYILARHDFINNTSKRFCAFCPVERRNNKLNVAQTFLTFNIDCGPDTVCTSNISVAAKFDSVRDNNTWVIGGSTDVKLKVNLKNHGEPAYLAMLRFAIPNGIQLRSILPSCQLEDDSSKTNLLVACGVGNPLWRGEEKNITLDLDMKNLIYHSIHDHKLNFSITFTTRSKNEGMQNITKTLNLINQVSLSLNGKANAEAYYLSAITDAASNSNFNSNISFQHTYQVYKLGATPIDTARLIIKVPVAITNNSDPLIRIYKPQIHVLGQLFECSSEDSLLDCNNELTDVRREPSLDQFNTYAAETNKMRQTVDYLKIKRSTNETSFQFDDILEFQNESIINDLLYMNCSTLGVYCTTIVCNLNALKTLQDIGKVSIKVVLNVEKLKDALAIDKAALKFATETTVEILKPAARVPVNGTKSTMELVTMFYNAPKRTELKLWIVIASVSVGLVLLIIVVAVLSMLGFFKRKGKQTNNEIPEEEIEVSAATIKPTTNDI